MYQDEQTLIDILGFAQLAVKYIGDKTFEEFTASESDRICVTHELLMTGEACNRISSEFQAAHPEIAWSKWIRLRNSIIHVYHRMDNLAIYEAARRDLPKLIEDIEAIMKEME